MHGGEPFKKLYTEYGYEEGTFPWFPKLTLDKPTKNGYYNILSKDGMEIYEYIDDPKQNMQRKAEGRYIGKKRVVFTKAKDPLTGIEGYRFVGFFIGDHYDENGMITYKRIDDKFKIIKKQSKNGVQIIRSLHTISLGKKSIPATKKRISINQIID